MEIPKGYTKVPVILLMAEEKLKMNLYIYMPVNKKLVHFRKKDEILTLDDLMTLKPLSSSQILMPEAEYQDALSAVAQAAVDGIDEEDGHISESTKTMAQFVLQNLKGKNGQASQQEIIDSIDDASVVVEKVLNQFKDTSHTKSYDELLSNLKENDPLATHNRHVGALSAVMMMAIGTFTMKDVADLAFAGFVHDCCLDQLPPMLSGQHLAGEILSMDNIKAPELGYFRHIDLALKKVADLKIPINENTKNTILQHHENFDGSGLKGLRGDKICKSAAILRVADDLVVIINNPKHQIDVKSAFELLVELNKNGRQIYDPSIMSFLEKTMFKS